MAVQFADKYSKRSDEDLKLFHHADHIKFNLWANIEKNVRSVTSHHGRRAQSLFYSASNRSSFQMLSWRRATMQLLSLRQVPSLYLSQYSRSINQYTT